MKNKFSVLGMLLLINACAYGDDTTLQDIIFEDPDTNEQIRMQIMEKAPSVKPQEQEDMVSDNETMVIYEANTYQLPSRDERYYNYAPLPEVYAIPAARATNKMLDETKEFYEQNDDVFLFINGLKKADRKLPDGIYKAEQVTKKIIEGSNTFKVTPNKNEADYVLDTIIENNGTPEEPILTYRMILLDKKDNKINEWSETVRRLGNDDRSWW